MSSSFLEWYLCVWEPESQVVFSAFLQLAKALTQSVCPSILIMLPLGIYMCLSMESIIKDRHLYSALQII